MRTTLTLDDDVAALLERLRKSRNSTLKEVVNEAIRLGLRELAAKKRSRRRFRMSTVDLGRCRIDSIDSVSDALAISEGDSFR